MNAQVLPFESKGYFSRSFSVCFRTPGIMQCLLLLVLINCIPLIGIIWTLGFMMKVCRNVAWGLKIPVSKSDLNFASCMTLGFKGLVVGIIFTVFSYLITTLLSMVFLGFLNLLVQIIIGVLGTISVIRCAIYNQISAAFNYQQISTMIKHDLIGLIRSSIAGYIGSIAIVLPASLLAAFFFMSVAVQALTLGSVDMHLDYFSLLMLLVGYNAPAFILLLILVIYSSLVGTFITYVAVSLWTIQFNVAQWGGSGDDLPPTLNDGEFPQVDISNDSCESSDCGCTDDALKVDQVESTGACSAVCDCESSVKAQEVNDVESAVADITECGCVDVVDDQNCVKSEVQETSDSDCCDSVDTTQDASLGESDASACEVIQEEATGEVSMECDCETAQKVQETEDIES